MCALCSTAGRTNFRQAEAVDPRRARAQPRRSPAGRQPQGASAFSLGDEAQGEILYGLRHIKNVGERVAAEIVAERDAAGPFVSLFDLCLPRGEPRPQTVGSWRRSSGSGACDSLGERGAMLAVLDRVIDRVGIDPPGAGVRGRRRCFGDTIVLIEPVSQGVRRGRPGRPRRQRSLLR